MKKCALNCPRSHYLSEKTIKYGYFKRRSDSKRIQRYKCLHCGHSFSGATESDLFGQKKRRINYQVYYLLVSGVSQRRAARFLNVNKTTIVRKFRFMADKLVKLNTKPNFFLPNESVRQIQFDHMESFEHSKLKPLSILLIVDKPSRKILAADVCVSPAKGLLVKKSLKKYGKRKDQRTHRMHEIFKKIHKIYPNIEQIESDQSPLYKPVVKTYYPQISYKQYKGRRGCVTGRGELKSGGFDPLFSLNHTAASLRENVNRLFRKTWCTTKDKNELQRHIDLYIHYHNTKLAV